MTALRIFATWQQGDGQELVRFRNPAVGRRGMVRKVPEPGGRGGEVFDRFRVGFGRPVMIWSMSPLAIYG
jgi:hypothetical protein